MGLFFHFLFTMRPGIVNGGWLSSQLKQNSKKLAVLDASWYLPSMKRSPIEEFKQRRIQGAKFFDLDGSFSDPNSKYPHMMPTREHFWENARDLGITKDQFIVAYDGIGIFSAARCWWMFRAMGWKEDRVAVLDGGFPLFASQHPDQIDNDRIETITNERGKDDLLSIYQDRSELIRSLEDIERNLEEQREIVVDARPKGRFDGLDPEPRPGIPSGHMPKAVSIPWTEVLDNGKLRDEKHIEDVFSYHNINITQPGKDLIFSCGSGVSAAIVNLAAHASGCVRKDSLYDGSWSEYADQSKQQRVIVSRSSYEEDKE